MEIESIVINKFGSASSLELESSEISPEISSDELLIEVKYSGINFADIIMRKGLYADAPPKPFTPGYEVSGIVKQVGNAITRFKVGDEVMAGTRFGGYSNFVKVKEWACFHLPSGLGLKEACALPVTYMTAYIACQDIARLRSGDKVLIDCATGGVGVIAMQMAIESGASVVGLTTSAWKKEFIESYGAKAMTKEEFFESSERDFDFVLNSSGGAELKQEFLRLARSGKLVSIGVQANMGKFSSRLLTLLKTLWDMPWFPILKLVGTSKMVGGFNALKYFEDAKWFEKHMRSIEDVHYKPYVGEVFKASDVSKAHQFIEDRKAKGKVLLEWS